MESINNDPDGQESLPLLSSNKPKSKFYQHVYGKRKTSKLDTIGLVVYLLHLLGMITLSVYVFKRPINDYSDSSEHEFRWFLVFAGITAICSLLLSPFVLILSHSSLIALISWNTFSMLVGSVGMVVTAGIFLKLSYLPAILGAGVFGIALSVFAVVYPLKSKEFVQNHLKASASIVVHRPVSWIINICTVVVNMAILGYGLYLIHEILLRFSTPLGILFSILSALSMAWNGVVISYIGYVTCAGSFGSWYFSFHPDSEERYPHGTLKAFLRSISVSLGSIAIGSLLLGAVIVLKALLKVLKKGECCGKKASKKVNKYANEYSMIMIALNGHSFLQASKEAKKIVDSKVTVVGYEELLLLTHAGGFATACTFVTLLLSGLYYIEPDYYGMDRSLYFFLLFIAMLSCSAWIAYTSVSPQLAAINTIFVCYIMDDAPFSHLPPTIYDALKVQIIPAYGELARSTEVES